MEKDVQDFWYYAKLWNTKRDPLAYQALLHMRSERNLPPKVYSRINSIEVQGREEKIRPLRSAPVA